jgi:quinol monooxygenase YgiN
VREEIEASVQIEPGALASYAVSDKDDPSHVTVFKMYADVDASKLHLEMPHFKIQSDDTGDRQVR